MAVSPLVVLAEFGLGGVVGHQLVRELAVHDGPQPEEVPRAVPAPPPQVPAGPLRVRLDGDQDEPYLVRLSKVSAHPVPVAVEARVLTVLREVGAQRHKGMRAAGPAARSGRRNGTYR